MKSPKQYKRFIERFSPVRKTIALSLYNGESEKNIIKRMSRGRKSTANAQAYVTMVKNAFDKFDKSFKYRKLIENAPPVRSQIILALIMGESKKSISKRMSKGRKDERNAKAFVTMAEKEIEKFENNK